MTDAALAPPHMFPPAPPALVAHPVVVRVKEALAAHYGDRLKQVILFGSRARGDAGPVSDWDFLALVEGVPGSMDDQLALTRVVTGPLELDLHASLAIWPIPPHRVSTRTILFHNIRAEGVAI
jgi:uncharacterized protein